MFILAINKDWLDYIYINLYNIIYQITWYLKNNTLKILYTAFTTYYSINANLNKWQRIILISNPALFIYKQPNCFLK